MIVVALILGAVVLYQIIVHFPGERERDLDTGRSAASIPGVYPWPREIVYARVEPKGDAA